MRPEIKVPVKSAIYDTIVKETKSPGTLLSWKLIRKKQNDTVLKSMHRQKKLVLIYQMEKISETVPLSLIVC
jgi:hypothetical protein